MPPDVAHLLENELGPGRVIADDERKLPFATDESGLPAMPPDWVVEARSAEEVTVVLRVAGELGVPVTPRGAGTGTTGGALAARGGIVLSTARMQRVLEIDAGDLVARVEPGVILGALHAQVEEQGLFYPPDPASLESCSIGGNVAENAGGPRAFKYGVTREYVLGLEVVRHGGERLRIGRRTAKGVTGYDLVGAFVGSEGTFGVVTEATLRLLPRPAGVATLLALFPSAATAAAAVTAVLRQGYRPRTLELMDRATIDHVRPKAPTLLPVGAGAALIIELDGDLESLEPGLLRCGEACEGVGALEVLVASDERERRRLWEARRQASPALREAHRKKVAEDIVVPRGAIPEMLARVERVGARHRLATATFGHAGDGNLHVNFLTDEDPADPAVAARLEAAVAELFAETVALSGTLTGEHGVGLTKRAYLGLEQPAGVRDLEERLKHAFDPRGLMNPGKIFP